MVQWCTELAKGNSFGRLPTQSLKNRYQTNSHQATLTQNHISHPKKQHQLQKIQPNKKESAQDWAKFQAPKEQQQAGDEPSDGPREARQEVEGRGAGAGGRHHHVYLTDGERAAELWGPCFGLRTVKKTWKKTDENLKMKMPWLDLDMEKSWICVLRLWQWWFRERSKSKVRIFASSKGRAYESQIAQSWYLFKFISQNPSTRVWKRKPTGARNRKIAFLSASWLKSLSSICAFGMRFTSLRDPSCGCWLDVASGWKNSTNVKCNLVKQFLVWHPW